MTEIGLFSSGKRAKDIYEELLYRGGTVKVESSYADAFNLIRIAIENGHELSTDDDGSIIFEV